MISKFFELLGLFMLFKVLGQNSQSITQSYQRSNEVKSSVGCS